MHRKSETFGKFKEFRACVENQLGKTIKTFRSDRGGEFLDTEFIDYLLEHGIVSQYRLLVTHNKIVFRK